MGQLLPSQARRGLVYEQGLLLGLRRDGVTRNETIPMPVTYERINADTAPEAVGGYSQAVAVGYVTCHRSFIQLQLESGWVVRRLARVEQRAMGGAGRGCAADRPLR
jgi:hypothetical protein